jgi:hypothetical protein
MTHCPCLSGYFPHLPAIPHAHGAGAPLPDRTPTSSRSGESKMPFLPCALERHGLDPNLVRQEEDEQ